MSASGLGVNRASKNLPVKTALKANDTIVVAMIARSYTPQTFSLCFGP